MNRTAHTAWLHLVYPSLHAKPEVAPLSVSPCALLRPLSAQGSPSNLGHIYGTWLCGFGPDWHRDMHCLIWELDRDIPADAWHNRRLLCQTLYPAAHLHHAFEAYVLAPSASYARSLLR